MRVVVVGLGVQGRKRQGVAGTDVVATVDPVAPEASHRDIREVDTDTFDAALVCTPDEPKLTLLEHLLGHGKHVLVEKPLLADDDAQLTALEALADRTGAVCYTAYNHRFEPHIVTMRQLVRDGVVGDVYRVRLFYGNGTARDVQASPWRDRGAGVLPDLGSHLLDILLFCLDEIPDDLTVWAAHTFENRAPDHVVCGSRGPRLVELEMSLLSWRNHFLAEIVGSAGSITIESLCKWGPSTLTVRHRVLPSGRPPEEAHVLVRPDPTWEAEYDHFRGLCSAGRTNTLAKDLLLNRTLRGLSAEALASTV